MGLTAILTGVERNLSNVEADGVRRLQSAEQRFVTAVSDNGAVHTFIVDLDHAAQDAESVIKWVEHARGLAAIAPAVDNGGPTAAEVIESANDRIGAGTADDNNSSAQEGADA